MLAVYFLSTARGSIFAKRAKNVGLIAKPFTEES
jgi:hypothetical protein